MATYYAVNAGGNVETAATWSTVSAKDASRTGGAVVPGAADTCIVDNWSGNLTVSATTFNVLVLDFNTNGAYTGTITFTAAKTLTINTGGTIKLSASMSIAGTGVLNLAGAVSMTSNGKTFSAGVTCTTAGTKTLVDNWTISGAININAATVINYTSVGFGDSLTSSGGFTCAASMPCSGTTTITFTGGTITASTNAGFVANNVNINGNCTFGVFAYKTGVLKYISGTITTNNLIIVGSCTLNLGSLSWSNLYHNVAASTITLQSSLSIQTSIFVSWYALVFVGAFNVSCANLYMDSYISNGIAITIPSGQTLTVTNTLFAVSPAYNTNLTIKSGTVSSAANLKYTGSRANCNVAGMIFTDINASQSAQAIDNWYGSTLTRTVNIVNRTSQSLCDIFGII